MKCCIMQNFILVFAVCQSTCLGVSSPPQDFLFQYTLIINKALFFPFTATEENLNHSDLADPESIPDSAPPVDLVEITVPKNKNDKKYVSHMGLVARKPVFVVSVKASIKPISSATETS